MSETENTAAAVVPAADTATNTDGPGKYEVTFNNHVRGKREVPFAHNRGDAIERYKKIMGIRSTPHDFQVVFLGPATDPEKAASEAKADAKPEVKPSHDADAKPAPDVKPGPTAKK